MAASGLIRIGVLKRCTGVGFEVLKKVIKFKDAIPTEKKVQNRLGPHPRAFKLPEIKNKLEDNEKHGVCINVWDCKNCRIVKTSDT